MSYFLFRFFIPIRPIRKVSTYLDPEHVVQSLLFTRIAELWYTDSNDRLRPILQNPPHDRTHPSQVHCFCQGRELNLGLRRCGVWPNIPHFSHKVVSFDLAHQLNMALMHV